MQAGISDVSSEYTACIHTVKIKMNEEVRRDLTRKHGVHEMEAVSSAETSGNMYQTTLRHIIQDCVLVRFEVSTVTMKNGVFWDVTPGGACYKRRLGGT
jgi:hypothetical protein